MLCNHDQSYLVPLWTGGTSHLEKKLLIVFYQLINYKKHCWKCQEYIMSINDTLQVYFSFSNSSTNIIRWPNVCLLMNQRRWWWTKLGQRSVNIPCLFSVQNVFCRVSTDYISMSWFKIGKINWLVYMVIAMIKNVISIKCQSIIIMSMFNF